jgi:peptidoglycan/LPS O-acetylase OafA/YrhL
VRTRNPSLDVIRAFAILEVIGFHLGLPIFSALAQFGVDLFFALSGFLISGLLFRDYDKYGTVRLKRFWIRRAFKILPPLYFFMAVELISLWNHETWIGAVQATLFTSNYFMTAGPLFHTWSLSLEEQFYIFLPLLLFFLMRYMKRPMASIPWVFAGVMIVTFILRIPNLVTPDTLHLSPLLVGTRNLHMARFELRADNLFVGVFLRYLCEYKPRWFQRVAKISLIPGLLCWVPAVMIHYVASPVLHSLLYTGIDIGCGCLVAWVYAHDGMAFWSWAPFRSLAWIGVYSYSIYLWQQPVVTLFCHIPGYHPNAAHLRPIVLAVSLLATAVAVLLGAFMGRWIEIPALRIRDHWFPEEQPTNDIPTRSKRGRLETTQSEPSLGEVA